MKFWSSTEIWIFMSVWHFRLTWSVLHILLGGKNSRLTLAFNQHYNVLLALGLMDIFLVLLVELVGWRFFLQPVWESPSHMHLFRWRTLYRPMHGTCTLQSLMRKEESLSYHNYYKRAPRFLQSPPKNHPI